MTRPTAPRDRINDLWACAAAELSDHDKRNINFNRPDKRNILAELHADAEKSRQRSVESRWKYTRKNGETIIIRDLFAKIIRWIDMFKQVGDIAVQYDPAHASLPWAGIRFLLQIVVNDINKHASVVEDLAHIAELIYRFALIEELYLQGTSKATKELEKAVVKLYASVLGFLSKSKQYLEQGTIERTVKSALLTAVELGPGLKEIQKAENDVNRCIVLVDKMDDNENHTKLVDLLTQLEKPMKRMDDELKNIHDDLQASKRTEIVRWLSPEPYIQHHKQTLQGVLTGTGQWLLSDPIFKKWKDDSASSMLWLHGIPGSGKSKLVSIVIEDALERYQAGDSPQPVFFYCSRNPSEPARSDPQAILASLARQLSYLEPGKPLLRPAIELFKDKQEQGFASGLLHIDESRNLIMQLISQYPLVTIVIDAMDECNSRKRHELIKTLEQILRDSSSLVKVFVSSRNDQDIVLQLRNYPNLEVDSQKNGDDITRFVNHQTKQLIQGGELLQYSTSQIEMKNLIVDKVIKGATGMFRWASMQLQYLCSFDLDADIKRSLGRLPPNLHTLYDELYEILSTKPGKVQVAVFKNVLYWLLSAQRTLKTEEFLCAVSVNPNSGDDVSLISTDLVLKICNNFIVFDSQLDTFRFAHLSVREFLEQRPEYNNSIANALAAEICLWTILSTSPDYATKKLLFQLSWHANNTQRRLEKLRIYADVYWATHCRSAGAKRKQGKLKMALRHILTSDGEATSSIELWHNRLQEWLVGFGHFNIRIPLEDAIPDANSASYAGLLLSCAFDFEEQVEHIIGRGALTTYCANRQGRSLLQIAISNGSSASLGLLLAKGWKHMEITAEVLKEAAENEGSGKEVMTLLLNGRSEDVPITEEVIIAAAANECTGHEVMKLILDWRGDVPITENVVKAAAGNWGCGKEVMTLLLDWQGEDVPITEEVVKAAACNWNWSSGPTTMGQPILNDAVSYLDQIKTRFRGHPYVYEKFLTIMGYFKNGTIDTPGVIEMVCTLFAGNPSLIRGFTMFLPPGHEVGVGKNEVMALLLDRRGEDVIITEGVVKAAAENRSSGKEVITLLLNRRGEDFPITEDIVISTAECFGEEVMTILLDRRGDDVHITPKVVVAAAGNSKEVMALLLNQCGDDVCITENVLIAAARNEYNSKEVMALLLNWCGDNIYITENVVAAAVRNEYNSEEVMALLLKRCRDNVLISENVAAAAVKNKHNKKKDIIQRH